MPITSSAECYVCLQIKRAIFHVSGRIGRGEATIFKQEQFWVRRAEPRKRNNITPADAGSPMDGTCGNTVESPGQIVLLMVLRPMSPSKRSEMRNIPCNALSVSVVRGWKWGMKGWPLLRRRVRWCSGRRWRRGQEIC